MIHFDPVPEPPTFRQQARRPGLQWLRRNQGRATVEAVVEEIIEKE